MLLAIYDGCFGINNRITRYNTCLHSLMDTFFNTRHVAFRDGTAENPVFKFIARATF